MAVEGWDGLVALGLGVPSLMTIFQGPGGPPLPDGLLDRLQRIADLVPHGQPEADEIARLRRQVRNWRRRLARIEREAAPLWDDWRGTAELIDEANARIEQLRQSG